MKTSTPKPTEPSWFVVDAASKPLGRLAADIAHILRGKHKPAWSAHQVWSDHVIVVNAGNVVLMGNKSESKVYYRHSGYLGHLKTIPISSLLQRKPESVLIRAVKGMLPRNRLREKMMDHLHVYASADHPHEAQKPQPLSNAPGQSLPLT